MSYDYPRDAFIVSAAAAYSPDSQVFISYGTQTNDSLLQMYGFVEQVCGWVGVGVCLTRGGNR